MYMYTQVKYVLKYHRTGNLRGHKIFMVGVISENEI